jgi:hypothetical protein
MRLFGVARWKPYVVEGLCEKLEVGGSSRHEEDFSFRDFGTSYRGSHSILV